MMIGIQIGWFDKKLITFFIIVNIILVTKRIFVVDQRSSYLLV